MTPHCSRDGKEERKNEGAQIRKERAPSYFQKI